MIKMVMYYSNSHTHSLTHSLTGVQSGSVDDDEVDGGYVENAKLCALKSSTQYPLHE